MPTTKNKKRIGVIQYYRPILRYGIILEDDGEDTFRFSKRELTFTPKIGDKVTFKIMEGKKRAKAVDVKPHTYI